MSTTLRAAYDKNVARIKQQYGHEPLLANALIEALTNAFGTLDAPDPVADEPAPTSDVSARVRRIIENTGVTRQEALRRIAEADGTAPKSIADIAADPDSPEAADFARYVLGDNAPDRFEDDRSPDEILAAAQADAEAAAAWRELTRIDVAAVDANAARMKADADQSFKNEKARKALRDSGIPVEQWPVNLRPVEAAPVAAPTDPMEAAMERARVRLG